MPWIDQKRSVSNPRGKVGVELSIQGAFLTQNTVWLLSESYKRDLWKLVHCEEMAVGTPRLFYFPFLFVAVWIFTSCNLVSL